MKLAILGTGMIVDMILRFYTTLPIEETYLLSTKRSYQKAQQMAESYGFKGVYDDYDQLLSEADFDTVYIGLPNHLHFDYAIKAIEAGKNVICEKPMVTNVNEMTQLIKAAQVHDVIILEAMTVHYLPLVTKMASLLDSLGDLKMATLHNTHYSSRYDAFRAGTILPAFDPEKCGGSLYDINDYNLHLALCLFGQPKASYYHATVEQGIDTHGVLILDYGTFKVSCIGAKDCFGSNYSQIQGTDGEISYIGGPGMLTGFDVTYKNGDTKHYHDDVDYAHRYEFMRFIEIIDHHDRRAADELMAISVMANDIMALSRQQAAIILGNDERK